MGGRLRKDKLSEEQVGERLAVVDAYEASGLSGEAFAQSRGIRYLDLRGWASHAPRWVLPAPGLSSATGVSSACSTGCPSSAVRIASASGCSHTPPMPIHAAMLERGMRAPERA